MAYCTKCGQEVADSAVFCPACGAEIGSHFASEKEKAAGSTYTYTNRENTAKDNDNGDTLKDIEAKAQEFGKKAADTFNELNDTPDYTNSFSENDAANNKALAVLAYLNFLVVIPIFAGKNSPFARFHSNQGLLLFIIELLIGTVDMLLGWTGIIRLACKLLYLATFVMAIIGIINAVNGKAKELPIIGGIKILK